MDDREISIMEALNQVQSWINSGEIDKALQGCKEILQIEPGNQRTLSLLKQAESLRFDEEKAAQDASTDPLENLEVEEKAPVEAAPIKEKPEEKVPYQSMQEQMPKPEPKPEMDYSMYQAPRPSKKKLFLAMAIPAVVVVVFGSAIVMMINNANRDAIINGEEPIIAVVDDPIEPIDTTNNNTPDKESNYIAENEQRVADLSEMAQVIDAYWDENGHYPSLNGIEDILNEAIGKTPKDPRQGETDKDGDPFGYIYSVYIVDGDSAGAYILSAILEDSKGNAHAWTQGASTKNYPDYREVDNFNVTYIGE